MATWTKEKLNAEIARQAAEEAKNKIEEALSPEKRKAWGQEIIEAAGEDLILKHTDVITGLVETAVAKSFAANEELQKVLSRADESVGDAIAAQREKERAERGKSGVITLDLTDANCPRTAYFKMHNREDKFTMKMGAAGSHKVDVKGQALIASLYFEAKMQQSLFKNVSIKEICEAKRSSKSFGIDAPWLYQDLLNLWEYEQDRGLIPEEIKHWTAEKALNATEAAAGGSWIPTTFLDDVIMLARVRSTFLSAGPTLLNVKGTGQPILEERGETTPDYYGENEQVNSTEMSVGSRTIKPKRFAVLTSFSKHLLRNGLLGVDFIRENATRTMATTIDQKALRNDGGDNEIVGLQQQGTVSQATAGTSLDNKMQDLTRLRLSFVQSNHDVDRMAQWMSPRTVDGLFRERVDGDFPFQKYLEQGSILGGRLIESNHIPSNLGGGGNESLILGACMDQVVWATAPAETTFEMLEEVYPNASGTLVSAKATDTMGFGIQMYHDLFSKHPNAVGAVTAVTY